MAEIVSALKLYRDDSEGYKEQLLDCIDSSSFESMCDFGAGHADKHAESSLTFNLGRILHEHVSSASAYRDMKTLKEVSQLVCFKQADNIVEWLYEGHTKSQKFSFTFDEPVNGECYTNSTDGVSRYHTRTASVILHRDPASPQGFFVKSSFPDRDETAVKVETISHAEIMKKSPENFVSATDRAVLLLQKEDSPYHYISRTDRNGNDYIYMWKPQKNGTMASATLYDGKAYYSLSNNNHQTVNKSAEYMKEKWPVFYKKCNDAQAKIRDMIPRHRDLQSIIDYVNEIEGHSDTSEEISL